MWLKRLHIPLLLLLAAPVWASVSFNRDVRPILAENCFECHGPSKAKGDLRLDIPGYKTPEEILRRVRTADSDERMPPLKAGKALRAAEVAALESWVKEGAKWDRHWAFEKIVRPSVPKAPFPETAENSIDAFVQQSLGATGLTPGPVAEQRTLQRRLAFDLWGLPPVEGQEGSWEQTVDAYMAAPAFGERMASWWLDLVRYADSDGYFYDHHRNIYPYRDYVVRSFNERKPFDRFTMEQIAGDLLPGAGWEEKIASGYNRLVMTTREDGANAADYRARYAADRVKNLGSVWLGLTLGCAQCHDHKSDPISSADFYRTAAFFANVKEEAISAQREVFIVAESPEYKALLEKSADLERTFAAQAEEAPCEQILAEQKIREAGQPPAYWPRSRKTDEVVRMVRKRVTEGLSAAEEKIVADYFRRHYDVELRRQMNKVAASRLEFEAGADKTLITEPGPMRIVRVLQRGDWLDETSPQVQPAFPEFLGGKCDTREPLNRLDLARWLVAPENPLTARVLANRLWHLFFGAGLVETLDDFGANGKAPSNPELLDWLASELIESGWDITHVVRLIVTSHTYRQISGSAEGDPGNRLFSRQNALSLSGEFVRDNALAVSGLLSSARGGPPIKTYLPADYLKNAGALSDEPHVEETGERLYRRALYLERKRAFLNPTLAAFNASARNQCVSERPVGGTPPEALTQLNAPEFVEAARALAERMINGGENDRARLNFGFKVVLGRTASAAEEKILLELATDQLEQFQKDPVAAAKYIRIGNLRWPDKIAAADLAAWSNVARALLNLKETNTRY